MWVVRDGATVFGPTIVRTSSKRACVAGWTVNPSEVASGVEAMRPTLDRTADTRPCSMAAMAHAMRKIGLLGGMSWESSALYYAVVNEAVRERLGGYHSARVVMSSVDFAEVEAMQVAGEWGAAGELLAREAAALEAAGAECLVLCTNTMHKVADAIEAATTVPLLHIVDVANPSLPTLITTLPLGLTGSGRGPRPGRPGSATPVRLPGCQGIGGPGPPSPASSRR